MVSKKSLARIAFLSTVLLAACSTQANVCAAPVVGPVGFTWPSIDWGYAHGDWWSSGGGEASQQPPPSEEIWAEAKIEGAASATLFWSTDGSNWNQVPMQLMSSDEINNKIGSMWWLRISNFNYVGIVPGQSPGVTIKVYIVATAEDGSTTTGATVSQPIGWGYIPGAAAVAVVLALLVFAIYRYRSRRAKAKS